MFFIIPNESKHEELPNVDYTEPDHNDKIINLVESQQFTIK